VKLDAPKDADEVELDFQGHRVRVRVRSRMCGRDCSGCPHEAVVVELAYPGAGKDGKRRRRELWGAPPDGRGQGPARTHRVNVHERPAIRGPRTTKR
jgi:hypothetical protein